MNARRRPRLFLDHKPPLIAFVLVAVTCLVMTLHMARSQATPGWVRAGIDAAPLVGQRVLAGALVERAPVPQEPPVMLAAEQPSYAPTPSTSPLLGSQQHGDGDRAGDGGSQPSLQVGAAQVGADTPESHAPDDASADDPAPEDDGGPRQHGHRGDDGDLPPVPESPSEPSDESDQPTPRDSNDWRDEWVGDHGSQGHHGHGNHGHGNQGHGNQGHGNPGHGSSGQHGHGNHGHEAHEDHGRGHGQAHGHGHH